MLRLRYNENQQQALQKPKKLIIEQKSTFDMLTTWGRAIFRPDSQDLALLKNYLSDFASAAELPFAIKQQTQNPLLPCQLVVGLDAIAMARYHGYWHFAPLDTLDNLLVHFRNPTAKQYIYSGKDQAAAHKVATAPLLPGQLLIPANGQCLYTTVIMSYLLPIRKASGKVTANVDQLFGYQPAYYLNPLYETLQNPIHYLIYLHSDAFSTLVAAFMARMQIKRGTWGGPQEIKIIADKLKVNIQEYYPNPNNPTNLVRSDLTTPPQGSADTTLHIVRDKVHPAEVLTNAQKDSAEDNPHYQHYRLKYTLSPAIPSPVSPSTQPSMHQMRSPQKSALLAWFEAAKAGNRKRLLVLYQSYNINVDEENEGNYTALLWSASKGHLDCVKYLVQQNANIHYKNRFGYTALVWSAQNGHVPCVKYLAQQGADIHYKNSFGNTALLLSAEKGHLDCLKSLLQQGAHLHDKNEDNNTALILSAKYGHLACVKYLVQQGADLTWQGEEHKTVLAWAEKEGKQDVVNYLSNLPDHQDDMVDID